MAGIRVHGVSRTRTVSALAPDTQCIQQQSGLSALVLFGAGNFIYIAASDLVPEIKEQKSLRAAAWHFGFFVTGLAVTLALAYGIQP